MKYQYFISSRWRNKEDVLRLTRMLRELGKTVYCFFEDLEGVDIGNHDEEMYMKVFEAKDWRNDQYVKKVFDKDMNAQKDSECLIMLLPAGKSAHIEAGAAYGMGKRCILIGEQKEAESLYLIFNENYRSIEDFISHIKD